MTPLRTAPSLTALDCHRHCNDDTVRKNEMSNAYPTSTDRKTIHTFIPFHSTPCQLFNFIPGAVMQWPARNPGPKGSFPHCNDFPDANSKEVNASCLCQCNTHHHGTPNHAKATEEWHVLCITTGINSC